MWTNRHYSSVIYLGFVIRFFLFVFFFFFCMCLVLCRQDETRSRGNVQHSICPSSTNDNDLLAFSLQQPLAYIEVVRIQHTLKRSMFVWETRTSLLCNCKRRSSSSFFRFFFSFFFSQNENSFAVRNGIPMHNTAKHFLHHNKKYLNRFQSLPNSSRCIIKMRVGRQIHSNICRQLLLRR